MLNSRVEIEIDFQDSTPIWAATSRSGVGYVDPLPPTFTAHITSPDLGSTVSGTSVTVSTSVVDSVTISSVDLFKDGTLFASTTSSPYTFSWDTTKDANGPHTLMVTANDAAGNTTSFSAAFTANNINTQNPPSITTSSLPGATQNVAYNTTLAVTGGTTPYTWSIVSGTLPAGLALAPGTGAISGTPTGTGTSTFTVQVTDAKSMTATKSLSVTVTATPTPSIATASLPGATQNVAYNSTLLATGGTAPYSWSIASGTLPTGLALAPSTGAISGTPTGTGTSTFTVRVTDANSMAATKSLSVTVTATPTPVVTTTSLPAATQNVAYNATLIASGGTTPYTWSVVSGALPAGLSLASTTGLISGTPTGTGTSTFTLRVTDANSMAATKSLSVTVTATPAPSITTALLPAATQNVVYNATLIASGGPTPYTWSLISGALPSGLSLAAGTGAISGTPTGAGTTTFTVQVTDAKSMAATKSLSVMVTGATAPSITATSGTPQSATINTTFGAALTATVRSGNGQPLPGATVTFTAPAQTGPSGTFAGGSNTATTNASGVATSPVFTANSIAGGPYPVTATAAGAATPATFLLTNSPKLATAVRVKAGTPQRSIVDTALPAALEATVTDANGNPVPGVSVTFMAPPNGASGAFTGGGVSAKVTTDASGVATAPMFTTNGTAGGPYDVTATIAGIGTSAAFSITNVDFALAQSVPGTVQLAPGMPANIGLTFTTTPTGSAFPSDVYLKCVIPSSVSTSTCTLNPAKISANSPSGSAAELTVTSTADLPPLPKRQDPRTPYLPWGAVAALAGLMAIYSAAWQKTVPFRGRMAFLALALLAITSAGLMGCVGLLPAQNGPSSVTVTATSGGVTKMATVTIDMK